jgi:hypothetical protein
MAEELPAFLANSPVVKPATATPAFMANSPIVKPAGNRQASERTPLTSAQQYIDQNKPPEPTTDYERWSSEYPWRSPWGLSTDFLDTATAGVADEVGAAGGAIGEMLSGRGADLGSAYDTSLNDIRAARDRHREENPTASLAAQLMGGVYTGGIGARWASQAPALMPTIMRGAAVGSGYGGAAGFGSTDGDFLDRLKGAAGGALAGGAVGGAVPPLIAGLGGVAGGAGKLGTRIRDAFTTGSPNPPHLPEGAVIEGATSARPGVTEAARREIAIRMQRDGMTPDDIAYQLKLMGDDAVIADAGSTSTQRLLDTTAQLPGETSRAVDDFMTGRQYRQGDRINQAAGNRLGTDGNFYQNIDQLNATMKAKAGPLYRQAYAENPVVNSPQVMEYLNRPAMQDAMRNATRMMRNEGVDPNQMGVLIDDAGNVSFESMPSLQTLDYIKRGLDDVLDSYRDKTTGRLVLNTEGRGIENLRRDYVAALDEATGGPESVYAAARAAYAGPASQKAAMDAGRRVFKADAEVTQKMIADMAMDERAAYLEGVAKAIQDMTDKGLDASNSVRALFGTPAKRRALAAAFDDPDQFAKFQSDMLKEAAFSETKAATAKGSQTFSRLADSADMAPNLLSAGAEALTAGPGAAMASVGRKVFQAGTPESVRNEIGRILLSGDPSEIAGIQRIFGGRLARMLAGQTAGNATVLSQPQQSPIIQNLTK